MNSNKLFSVERETLEEVSFKNILISDLVKLNQICFEINEIFECLIKERDTLIISIQGNGEPEEINYNSQLRKADVEEAIRTVFEVIDDGDFVKIRLSILKNNIGHKLSIYSLEKISEFFRYSLENKSVKTVEEMISFSISKLYFDKVQTFELINDVANFSSRSFIFTDTVNKVNNIECDLLKIRNTAIDIREKNCNLIFDSIVPFTPEDFFLETDNGINEDIRVFFNCISLILSLSFIVDTLKIKDNFIEYKMYGYRNMHKCKNYNEISDLNFKNKEFFDIYHWIYEEHSNISERIGMARNVLSLFSTGDDIFVSQESALPSIKSSFEIYLKENVDKYIEVLNQVVLLLNELNNETSQLAENFINKFKNNLIAIFTFFSSTILFNTISTGKIENIFTKDITIITIVFLIVSAIYLIISYKETDVSIEKLKRKYEINKSYYNTILNPDDLIRIYKNDQYYNNDVSHIKEIRKLYTFFWIFILSIILIILFFLGTLSDSIYYIVYT